MKLLLLISAGMVIVMISFIALINYVGSNTVTVQYDCRMLIGGWHSDFPVKVVEQCRNKNKKDNYRVMPGDSQKEKNNGII
jgi:hypothetical protein